MVRVSPAFSLAVSAALCLLLLAEPLRAEIVFSNLETPPNFGAGVGQLSPPNNVMIGQGFRTGSTAPGYRLNAVTLNFDDATGNPGDFKLELYEGLVSGTANGTIGEFLVTTNPLTAGQYTFPFAGNLILAPGKSYMIVASAPNAAGPDMSQYHWYRGTFQPIPPAESWTDVGQVFSFNGGVTWTPVRAAALQFAIDAASIPEPSGVLLAAIVIAAAPLRRRSAASRA